LASQLVLATDSLLVVTFIILGEIYLRDREKIHEMLQHQFQNNRYPTQAARNINNDYYGGLEVLPMRVAEQWIKKFSNGDFSIEPLGRNRKKIPEQNVQSKQAVQNSM
jgi:hypothetical protein